MTCLIHKGGDFLQKWMWKILLCLGCVPFLIAVGFCLVTCLTDSWSSFWDCVILYSFLYWPTYVIGIVLIVLSVVKIRKKHFISEEHNL